MSHSKVITTRSTTTAPVQRPARLPASRIANQEWRRRLWHFFPGILAFIMTQIPHMDPIRLWTIGTGVALGLGLVVYSSIRFHKLYRRHPEEGRFSSTLGYGLPIIPLLLIFRGHLELGLAATTIIAFGDGSATMMGLLLRGPRLPWNRAKSIVGTVCFMGIGTLMASLVYWIEALPDVSYGTAVAVTAPVAICCALLESLPLRVNDNLVVSASASVLLLVMQTLLVGWM